MPRFFILMTGILLLPLAWTSNISPGLAPLGHIQATLVYDIPEPKGVCAECGAPIGSPHKPWCPYAKHSQSTQDFQQNPTGAPSSIPVVEGPLGVACGLVGGPFAGGYWFFSRLFTPNPKDGVFSSYHNHLHIKGTPEVSAFTTGLSAGSHITALPWLVLYPVGWTIKAGVTSVGKGIKKLTAPPDPSPRIREYNQIALIYQQSLKHTAALIEKRKQELRACDQACRQFLLEYIQHHPDLAALARTNLQKALKKAQKRLTLKLQAAHNLQRIQQQAQTNIAELEALRKEALTPVKTMLLETITGLATPSPNDPFVKKFMRHTKTGVGIT
ncbi:MAG: hypothetical protein D6820_09375, partial [Lentisphaerae bacterium]